MKPFMNKMRDSELFDRAVAQYFQPIAQELDLTLTKIVDGVYDMPSQHFIMRIRLHTGHRRGFNLILRPASWPDVDENDPNVPQLGIACFAQFHGETLQDIFIDVSDDKEFLKQADLLAAAAKRYAVSYLRGKGQDWDAVREDVRKKTEMEVEKLKELKLPPFVQKRWHLPND